MRYRTCDLNDMPEQLCRILAMGQLWGGNSGWAQTFDDLIFWSRIKIETKWDRSALHEEVVSFLEARAACESFRWDHTSNSENVHCDHDGWAQAR